MHEVESPIKHIMNKNRKIKLVYDDILLNNITDDIHRNVQLIRSWTETIETINVLFLRQELKPNINKINLRNIIDNSIYWKKDVLSRTNRSISHVNLSGLQDDLFVYGDQSHYYQIFLNLLENSIKYSNRSENSEIKIYSESNNSSISIYIEDWGIGIENNEREKIFQIQYRSIMVEEMKYKGEGYGLWLIRELLKANNAVIELNNNKNPTRFKLTIKN